MLPQVGVLPPVVVALDTSLQWDSQPATLPQMLFSTFAQALDPLTLVQALDPLTLAQRQMQAAPRQRSASTLSSNLQKPGEAQTLMALS